MWLYHHLLRCHSPHVVETGSAPCPQSSLQEEEKKEFTTGFVFKETMWKLHASPPLPSHWPALPGMVMSSQKRNWVMATFLMVKTGGSGDSSAKRKKGSVLGASGKEASKIQMNLKTSVPWYFLLTLLGVFLRTAFLFLSIATLPYFHQGKSPSHSPCDNESVLGIFFVSSHWPPALVTQSQSPIF